MSVSSAHRRLTGLRVLAVALALTVATGCDPAPAADSASEPTVTSGSADSVGPQLVDCSDAIGDDPPSDGTVVLDVIGLPTAPDHPVLQAEPDGEAGYFAKTGIAVRTDTTVRLTVAADQAGVARIGWGSPGIPSTDLTIDCPGPADWVDFPGGYFVDEPLCLTLTVESDGRSEQVSVGVGAACPGQAPPA